MGRKLWQVINTNEIHIYHPAVRNQIQKLVSKSNLKCIFVTVWLKLLPKSVPILFPHYLEYTFSFDMHIIQLLQDSSFTISSLNVHFVLSHFFSVYLSHWGAIRYYQVRENLEIQEIQQYFQTFSRHCQLAFGTKFLHENSKSSYTN